jgi:hypothetical protein
MTWFSFQPRDGVGMAAATATAVPQQHHHQSPGEITTASSPDALSSLGLDLQFLLFWLFSSGFWRCPLAAEPGTIRRADRKSMATHHQRRREDSSRRMKDQRERSHPQS